MHNFESLELEALRLQLLESYARSQETHLARVRSLQDHARARIVFGIIRLVLFVSLAAVGVSILLTA